MIEQIQESEFLYRREMEAIKPDGQVQNIT